MDHAGYTNADVAALFRLDVGRQALMNAEKSGAIPEAKRVQRGAQRVRVWSIDQLPAIGSRYGCFKAAKHTQCVCVYTAKGGTLKSSLTWSMARILSLHGIRTLVIGLDPQGSITELALRPLARTAQTGDLDDLRQYPSLFEVIVEGLPVREAIRPTDIPTLHVLPENPSLTRLDRELRLRRGPRETLLRDRVLKELHRDYDLIMIDNAPSWSGLTELALVAADHVLSPVGCEPGSYQALPANLSSTYDFADEVGKRWKTFLIVPTLLERTKLSSQIYAAYVTNYKNKVTEGSIRRAIRGAEAFAQGRSPIEVDPRGELANDYYELVREIWSQILATETAE